MNARAGKVRHWIGCGGEEATLRRHCDIAGRADGSLFGSTAVESTVYVEKESDVERFTATMYYGTPLEQ